MYTNDKDAYRKAYFDAWQKHQKQALLEPIEMQLVNVMLLHPEYHNILNSNAITQSFELGENPFIHMSLHLAIQDQLQTQRPQGVMQIYQDLLAKHEDAHTVQHYMMDCLAQIMWQAQQTGVMPDENAYLQALRSL